MLLDYLNEYLDVTKKMLKIEDISSVDELDSLLNKRAVIQNNIDKAPKEEIDEEMKEILNKIVKAESQITERMKHKMDEIQQGLDQVKKDRLTHGKNKLAFQKFMGKNTGGIGYYFDRKK